MRSEQSGIPFTTAGSATTPDVPAGTDLFCELARVVVELAELEGLRSLTLPYPPAAQHALDRIVLHCLNRGEAPPSGLPELLEWCRCRPSGDPLFQVSGSFVTPDTMLVHPVGLMPTRACLELASHGPDTGVEGEALALLSALEARCGSAELYRRSRRFLACHPVVQQRDRFQLGWDKVVWSNVKDLYRPVPENLLAGGTFLRCLTCRLPALLRDRKVPVQGPPVSGPDSWCEGETCPHGVSLELIRDPTQAWLLRRPLRVFLSLPREVEEAALGALDQAGIGYDALAGDLNGYRLRAAGSGGCIIQVHDRVQPTLLASRYSDMATRLPGLTLVVVPSRFAERDDYRAAFTAALPDEIRDRVLLTAPTDLVSRVGAAAAADSYER